MFKVGFVQWQTGKDLPHMNMPLFVKDIKDLGCNVECICVNGNKSEEFIEYFKYQKINLLATDYICPYSVIAKIKRISPRTKIVVGGNGFFDIFLKTEIDFGIIGAGRKSILMLVDALRNGKDLSSIPNLFFKYLENDINIIDYSGKDIDFNLEKELFPYTPHLKWKYVGFENNANGPVNKIGSPPTVIADFGCPYRSGKLKNNCRNIDLELSNCIVTNKAQIRLNKLFNERLSGGCAFCTYNAYFSLSVKQTNNYLIDQMRYLQKEYGFDKFSIGSEYPFRFLVSLINQIFEEKIRLKQINIRSRINWLLKSEKALIKALNLAVKHGFKITIWQLGFESFHQKHLDLYNKKQTVEENLKAIKLLDSLEKKYRENFSNLIESHGILGITPWTKIEDIIKEFKVLKQLPLHWREKLPFLSTKAPLNNAKLILYDPLLPIYKKIKSDGLLIRNNDSYDDFKIMDTDVRRVLSYLNSGLIYEQNKKYDAAIKMYKRVLRALPNNCYIYFILGRVYFSLKKYKYAIKKTVEALKLGSTGSSIHFLLGFSYEKIKKYRQAIEELKKGEKINPESPKEVSFCLAKCYKHIEQVRLFDKELKKGLRKLKSIIPEKSAKVDTSS
jgi:tetratricopeptide (TPR) repeat protein